MDARILNLDGGLVAQQGLVSRSALVADISAWGPRIRMGCSFGRYRRFERALAEGIGARFDQAPTVTFVGSGDFHHVSLALVRRQTTPVNLLVLDNHPDWMRGVPIMHCGTWLYHAARLPSVRQVFHVGGDVDFDNYYRWMAPWPALDEGRIAVLPARRRFRVGRWRRIPGVPLLAGAPITPERMNDLLAPYQDRLAACPLYISLDKDVLQAIEGPVNWDSGHLRLTDALTVLGAFLEAAGGRLAGMDVVGDWSPVRVSGPLRWFLDWSEHVPAQVDPAAAAEQNQATNLRILDFINGTTGAIRSVA